MRPSPVSTRNMRPGSRRPFRRTSSGAMSRTPVSEAMITRSSLGDRNSGRGAGHCGPARRPPCVPSVKANRSRSVPGLHEASVVGIEVLLGGRHGGVMLPGLGDQHHDAVGQGATRVVEQFQSVVQYQRNRCPPVWPPGSSLARSSPNSSEAKSAWRAFIQLILPRRVLISPLWHRKRNGWARSQDGRVLVL